MLQSAAILGLCTLRLSMMAVPADRVPVEQKAALPEGGVSLLNSDPLVNGWLSNHEKLPAEVQVVDVEDQPFQKALQIKTEKPVSEWWSIQFLMPTVAPVNKGDALLATFYIRCIETKDETGEAYVRAVFEAHKPPVYNKSLVAQFSASRRWIKIQCPFTVIETTPAEGSTFGFAFPTGPQIVQIGGVTVTNYGASVPDSSLPRSSVTYTGRELDAPWRAEAQQRIDKIRKADLAVTVKDSNGKPVLGARVVVNMTRHGFPFGTAVVFNSPDGRRSGTAYGKRHWFTERDEQQYDYWLKRWFTKVTPEVALMPDGWSGHWPNLGREVGIAGVRKYHDMGYDVRGHILVWPGWRWFHLPGIQEAKNDPQKLGKMVIDHITDETTAVKEWIDEWTLLNEPFSNRDLMDVLGDDAMVEWFKVGHEADPKAKLYINDFSILSGGGLDRGHQDHYEKVIQFLIDKGAPLHGIGMQGHFGDDPTSPDKVYQILERFAKFGKDIQITEFDVNTRNNQLQADFTRDFMTICFSHPSVVAFSFWGFWENAHWRPDGAMIDKDWKLKPSGEAFEKLVLHDWWTEEEGVTNAKGVFSVRGFLGDYRVVAISGDISQESTFNLKPGQNNLEIVLGTKTVAAAKPSDAVAKQ